MKRTHTHGLAGFVFLAALLLAPAALARDDKIQEPLATIHGAVQSSTPKKLVVETGDSNTLEFFCTRKTRYFEAKKRITSADLAKGDLVGRRCPGQGGQDRLGCGHIPDFAQ